MINSCIIILLQPIIMVGLQKKSFAFKGRPNFLRFQNGGKTTPFHYYEFDFVLYDISNGGPANKNNLR